MRNVKIVVLIALFILLGYWGFRSYHAAKAYEHTNQTIAEQSDAASLAEAKLDHLTSVLSFGLIEDETKARFARLAQEQNRHHQATQRYLYYFLATLLLIITIGFTCSLTAQTFILATGSLYALILGLINPILMIIIHKEVEYLGKVVLSFESKGILDSVQQLLSKGEMTVGITILLFSVLIPFAKIMTLMIALIAKELHITTRLIGFFKYLGKWSMLDVFVVATFLVYLSSNNSDLTHAEIEVGLYYFLLYVLLSMVTTFQTQKVLTQVKSPF